MKNLNKSNIKKKKVVAPKPKKFVTDIEYGLNQEQIDERTLMGLTNNSETKTSKSYAKILISNIFTFFNIIITKTCKISQ